MQKLLNKKISLSLSNLIGKTSLPLLVLVENFTTTNLYSAYIFIVIQTIGISNNFTHKNHLSKSTLRIEDIIIQSLLSAIVINLLYNKEFNILIGVISSTSFLILNKFYQKNRIALYLGFNLAIVWFTALTFAILGQNYSFEFEFSITLGLIILIRFIWNLRDKTSSLLYFTGLLTHSCLVVYSLLEEFKIDLKPEQLSFNYILYICIQSLIVLIINPILINKIRQENQLINDLILVRNLVIISSVLSIFSIYFNPGQLYSYILIGIMGPITFYLINKNIGFNRISIEKHIGLLLLVISSTIFLLKNLEYVLFSNAILNLGLLVIYKSSINKNDICRTSPEK